MKYYLDTSIWLDLFEERSEQGLPKGRFAKKLLRKIVAQEEEIIFSDIVLNELRKQGYPDYEVKSHLSNFGELLVCVAATENQVNRGKDLAEKREVPILDAVHALIAKGKKAVLVSRDRHFRKLKDIVKAYNPEELI